MKLRSSMKSLRSASVAPYTGAWIETTQAGTIEGTKNVAPYTGAWIETPITSYKLLCISSRPLHGGVD